MRADTLFVGSTSWTWTRVGVSSGGSGAVLRLRYAGSRQRPKKPGRSIEALLTLVVYGLGAAISTRDRGPIGVTLCATGLGGRWSGRRHLR
jgi:hypothetical protein